MLTSCLPTFSAICRNTFSFSSGESKCGWGGGINFGGSLKRLSFLTWVNAVSSQETKCHKNSLCTGRLQTRVNIVTWSIVKWIKPLHSFSTFKYTLSVEFDKLVCELSFWNVPPAYKVFKSNHSTYQNCTTNKMWFSVG